MSQDISFKFNGNPITMTVEDHWTLLHLIREELGYGWRPMMEPCTLSNKPS
jgi:aerobic-type carbon monoxide dehydrogenase small subunit (CoxS/CutS family)